MLPTLETQLSDGIGGSNTPCAGDCLELYQKKSVSLAFALLDLSKASSGTLRPILSVRGSALCLHHSGCCSPRPAFFSGLTFMATWMANLKLQVPTQYTRTHHHTATHKHTPTNTHTRVHRISLSQNSSVPLALRCVYTALNYLSVSLVGLNKILDSGYYSLGAHPLGFLALCI